jgi:hypothetical protein
MRGSITSPLVFDHYLELGVWSLELFALTDYGFELIPASD